MGPKRIDPWDQLEAGCQSLHAVPAEAPTHHTFPLARSTRKVGMVGCVDLQNIQDLALPAAVAMDIGSGCDWSTAT